MQKSPFVVTPWRDSAELLELRQWFYSREGGVDRRGQAVAKVLAWRVRNIDLPLLLDSTADIVDAVVQDERGTCEHNALRLAYAAAVSRFVTGFTDTQLDLRRSRPSWLSPQSSPPFLDFPPALLEVRHSIVHRHLPPLSTLKKAAAQALAWLWEWYWSHLESGLRTNPNPAGRGKSADAEESVVPANANAKKAPGAKRANTLIPTADLAGTLNHILKSYLRARKAEIKALASSPPPSSSTSSSSKPPTSKSKSKSKSARKAAPSAAAQAALFSIQALNTPSSPTPILTNLLITTHPQILPSSRKLSSTMSGAFLLWTPLLLALAPAFPSFLPAFATALFDSLSSPSSANADADAQSLYSPTHEGLSEWLIHVLTAPAFQASAIGSAALIEGVLQKCFVQATPWHLRVAERVVGDRRAEVPGREMWGVYLEAAREQDADHEGGDEAMKVEEEEEDVASESEGSGGVDTDQFQRDLEMDVEMELEMQEAEAAAAAKVAAKTAAKLEKSKAKKAEKAAKAKAKEDKAKEEASKMVMDVKEVIEEKQRGPHKKVGLWRPTPIGVLPAGWEDDE